MKIISVLLIILSGFFLFNSSNLTAQTTDSIVHRDIIVSDTIVQTQAEQASYVILSGDSLFQIKADLGPYSPQERAVIISKRLELLNDNLENIETDSFTISESNNYSVINYKNIVILSISIAEADSTNKTREQLALERVSILIQSFDKLGEKTSLHSWVKKIGFTLLSLLGLFVIFFLLNKSFEWIDSNLVSYEKGIKRKRKNILKYLFPNKSNNVFLIFSKIIKIALTILILFLYLPFLFSFLPWTEKLVERFYSLISTPVKFIVHGFIDFIPNIFSIIIIVLIARYIIKVLNFVSKEIAEERLKFKGFHHDWARPTSNLVKIILYAITMVFIVQYLPQSRAFQGVSIFVGVLFTLGSTSAIANMIAGIVITYMRPFIIGDRVKIGETVGDVIEKNLLVTRLRTVKNEDITIPNATIINTQLWNYSKNASTIGIIIHPTVTIGYDVPSDQVIELLLNAAKNTKDLTREFKPFVLQKSLNDFYVEYELNVYTKQPKKMPLFYSELNKSILDEFNKAGVEILSPHYNAFRDGNASTIPDAPAPAPNPVEKVIDKITGKK